MRSLVIISIFAMASPVVADDLGIWAKHCLANGDAKYATAACQGFRAGVDYQRRQAWGPVAPSDPSLPSSGLGLPDSGGGILSIPPEQLADYLQNQSAAMSTVAKAIAEREGVAVVVPNAGPAVQAPAATPDMFRFDDPSGKPIVDF